MLSLPVFPADCSIIPTKDLVVTLPSQLPQENIDAEILAIQTLLGGRGRFLRFSASLEDTFRQHLQGRAIELLNHAWWLICAFYFFLGVLTWTQVQVYSTPGLLNANESVWWSIYLAEGAGLVVLLTLTRFSGLDHLYRGYTSVLVLWASATVTIGTSAFPDPYFNQHSSYVVILVTAIIYGVGGMQTVPAIIACTISGIISYGVIQWYGLWYNWGHFSQYVVLANVVGILLCYLLERRDRIMYLQSQLLELEKRRLDALSQEFNRLSREDALTGLANRRHFNEVFQQEWDRAKRDNRPLALIFVDVDHFKLFNDTHGHVEGDRALTQVGMALKTVLRRPGDMAARYGGEEFVLLLPSTAMEGARDVALHVTRAIAALRILHRASKVADHVTVSMGVASMLPNEEVRSGQLLAQADEAVYAAKEAGRNCIVVVRPDGSMDPKPLRAG